MIQRNLVIVLVILVAVLGSRLLLKRDVSPQPARSTSTTPGYYLQDAVIEGMDEQGMRLYTLRAERIVQTAGKDSVTLHKVNLQYGLPDSQPWLLRADDGEIPTDGQTIELRGNVTMEEHMMRGDVLTTITTPALDIDLRAHLASTDADVNIERGNYLISARGLSANLKEQNLTLKSEVHGRFLP